MEEGGTSMQLGILAFFVSFSLSVILSATTQENQRKQVCTQIIENAQCRLQEGLSERNGTCAFIKEECK